MVFCNAASGIARRRISATPLAINVRADIIFGNDKGWFVKLQEMSDALGKHPRERYSCQHGLDAACAYLQDVADIEDGGIAALAISDVNSIGRQPIGRPW